MTESRHLSYLSQLTQMNPNRTDIDEENNIQEEYGHRDTRDGQDKVPSFVWPVTPITAIPVLAACAA